MNLTPALLQRATGCRAEDAEKYAHHIDQACKAYRIDTPARLAAFLAQCGHESGSLRYVREIWGPTPAQQRYEGRADLGNTQPGDGQRFMGRGLIQTTGRHNYRAVRDRLRARGFACPDFEADPAALESPTWACWSAADYWDWRGLNALADRGDFEQITRRINGGLNGHADRLRRLQVAREALAGVWASPAPVSAPTAPPAPSAPLVQPGPEPADYYAPSGEAPEWVPPSQEQNMILPALAKGLAAVVIEGFTPLVREKLTKEMGRHTDSPEAAGAVADAVIGAAKTVTGLADPVQAVAAVRADPSLNQRAEADTLARLEQALPLLERINAMEVASIQSARQFHAGEPWMIDTPWLKLKFIHVLSLFFVSFSGWFVTQHWDSLTTELKGAVIALMIIGGWTGVRDYNMGSSSGSQAKDAVIGEITRRR